MKRKNRSSMKFVAMTALSLAMFGGGAASATAEPLGSISASAAAPAGMTKGEEQALELAQNLSKAFQRVAKEVTPAVVHITALKANRAPRGLMPDPFMMGTPQQETSYGSGIIVDSAGLILTNNHVVENARTISVALGDSRTYQATLVGRDPDTDVAVLRISGDTFPAAKLGDSDNVEVGEWVLAIGNPFGLNQTVTAGIISAKGRRLGGAGQMQNRARVEDFFQTDAAINPGNSGGALINLKGEVVGMNTAIFSRSGGYMGIGFAIPSNLAKGVMDSLVNTGSVQRGWLGVNLEPLTRSLAQSAGYQGTEGAYIAAVQEGSPAAGAGLVKGDIVVSVNGRAVDSEDALRSYIAGTLPGKSVSLEVIRSGKRVPLTAKVGVLDESKMRADAGEVSSSNRLGLAAANVTETLAEKYNIPVGPGVVVTSVDPDSPFAGNLQPGDRVFAINSTMVRTTKDFAAAAEGANFRQGVRVRFVRDGVEWNATVRDPNRR